jgi:tetratricopeptide (TPR) repeat protein
VLVLAWACRTTDLGWRASEPAWGARERAELAQARTATDAGRTEEAWAIVAPLSAADPADLDLGVWLQDLRLELAASGSRLDPALDPLLGTDEPEEIVRKLYAAIAHDSATPQALILAARVESDAIASLTLLDQALILAPDLAWVHYGKAHALLRNKTLVKRWQLAREAVQRALALDPGLIGARRLEAWMLAQEGTVSGARGALETWLQRTRDDVRVGAREREEAEIDLALLRVLDGDPSHGRELLAHLEGSTADRDRRLAVLAVAAAEMGDVGEAMEAARRAEAAAPEKVLPLVQQALLQQYWLGDQQAAKELWTEVIARVSGNPDIGTLLQGMRAKLLLEREAAEAASESKQ